MLGIFKHLQQQNHPFLKSGIDPTVTKDTLSLNPMAAAYRVF